MDESHLMKSDLKCGLAVEGYCASKPSLRHTLFPPQPCQMAGFPMHPQTEATHECILMTAAPSTPLSALPHDVTRFPHH